MRLRICSLLLTLALLVAPGFAQRLDNYGDPLPPGAVLRLGTTRLQARGGFCWMPDGKSLVTMKHGTIFFWDLADGHCRETMLAPFSGYRPELALSKDGQRLVCVDGSGRVAALDLKDIRLTQGPEPPPRSRIENSAPAISPTGETFVTLDGQLGELRIWDAAACMVRRTVKLPNWSGNGSRPTFSPDGKTVALSNMGANSLNLILVERDEPVTVVRPAHGFVVDSVTFAPDGERLFSTGTARLPPAPDGAHRWKTEVFLWDARGQKLGEWPLPDGLPSGCGLAFTSRGEQMVSVHQDRMLVWDTAKQSILRTIEVRPVWNPSLARVSVDPTDQLVAVDDCANYVRIWDLATGKPRLATDQHHQGIPLAAAWSPDGKSIATGDNRGETCLWNADSGLRVSRFLGPPWGHLAYLPGGSQLLLAGVTPGDSGTGILQWRETESGKLLREQKLAGRIRRFSLSPDGRLLAIDGSLVAPAAADPFASQPGAVAILESATGKLHRTLAGHAGRNVALGWTPEGKEIVTVSEDTVLRRTNVATGQVTADWKLEHLARERATGKLVPGWLGHAVFLKSGEGVVTSGDLCELYGWGTTTGVKHWTINTEAKWIRGLALSPDQKVVACIAKDGDNANHSLRLYDIAARRELKRFDLGRENCDRIVFSPDGTRLLVAFYDGTSLVYDVSAALNKVE